MSQGFLVSNPRMRFFDSNGLPLSNGWLYGYTAGTSTPKTFYSNSDLSSSHTNPAQLSASGEITIFLAADALYKFDLYDEDNVHQSGWPVDGVMANPGAEAPPAPPAAVPTGAILAYGGTAAPTGFLLCQGALVSRSTYADLFTAIGTAYGAGDGSTTFGLPDLRQRFPLGKAASGTGSTLGGTGGTIDHTHTGPSHTHATTVSWPHTHTVTVAAHTHDVTVPRGDWPNVSNAPSVGSRLVLGDSVTTYFQPTGDRAVTSSSNGALAAVATSAASGDNGSFTSGASGTGITSTGNPAFQAVNFIIKT